VKKSAISAKKIKRRSKAAAPPPPSKQGIFLIVQPVELIGIIKYNSSGAIRQGLTLYVKIIYIP
jgi:hypothetical protein